MNDGAALLMVVVQVYSPARGVALFAEGSGSPDQGGCASGDAANVGGFWWGGGLVMAKKLQEGAVQRAVLNRGFNIH